LLEIVESLTESVFAISYISSQDETNSLPRRPALSGKANALSAQISLFSKSVSLMQESCCFYSIVYFLEKRVGLGEFGGQAMAVNDQWL